MVVYGGGTKDTSQGFSGDAFALRVDPDTGGWRWTKLQLPPDSPSPGQIGGAAGAGGTSAVLFGGAEMRPTGYEGGQGLFARGRTWVLRVDQDLGVFLKMAGDVYGELGPIIGPI